LGQCAALRSLAQLTTPFLASGKAQNGVFSLRIAHIAPFYTINFFSDSPEGFALLLAKCAAFRSLAQLTTPFLASGKSQNRVFSTLSTKWQTFYTINLFSDSPEGFALLLGKCAAFRSLAQLTTPFLASGKAQNGVFSTLSTKSQTFYTISFFSDSPEGFALLLGHCAALPNLAQLTTPF